MSSKAFVWCSHAFNESQFQRLARVAAPAELVRPLVGNASNLVGVGRDPQLVDQCSVAFGQPDPADLFESNSLQFIQLTSAGYTRYDRDDLREHCRRQGIAMCTSSDVYAEPCAQHLLAMMLGVARQFPAALASQLSDRGWPYLALRSRASLLRNQVVLIVGFGTIATRLIELLHPFSLDVRAFRRTVTGREPVPCHRTDLLDQHIPLADHVVNILPASSETNRFFDADRFEKMKPSARFYNIGRGDTVDQAALETALRSGRLDAAFLDVTTPEPLPADHPLWTTPNCFITPHTGGGFVGENDALLDHFSANLSRFRSGQTLLNRVV
jgi:phosphoglycerate dehydrogenase-like enzyme